MTGGFVRPARALRILLAINAAATIAAAGVLALAPAAIPNAVGIAFDRSQNLIAYLLAASELAIGALCLLALRSTNMAAIRLAARVLIVLHAGSAVAVIAAVADQTSPLVLWNAAIRIVMVVALVWSLRAAGNRSAP
jgi:hypothetical protein